MGLFYTQNYKIVPNIYLKVSIKIFKSASQIFSIYVQAVLPLFFLVALAQF